MNPTFAAYLAALLSAAVLDVAWLASTFRALYVPRLGHLLAEAPSWAPAVAFYLLYAAGVTFLVALPALSSPTPLRSALLLGALLGAVAYATYDLTNQATLKAWPFMITLVDIAWGALLTALAALAATYAALRLGR